MRCISIYTLDILVKRKVWILFEPWISNPVVSICSPLSKRCVVYWEVKIEELVYLRARTPPRDCYICVTSSPNSQMFHGLLTHIPNSWHLSVVEELWNSPRVWHALRLCKTHNKARIVRIVFIYWEMYNTRHVKMRLERPLALITQEERT